MAGPNPRSIHVLFVHGVGTHSRLSSLLQPYQSLRADTRSPETPIEHEDLNPEWRLEDFEDAAGTPHLKLRLLGAPPGATDAVYLYEVNYSALAGVVRANHPLDLTDLFVGFDLAVSVARSRLADAEVRQPPPGAYDIDHVALAAVVQRLAGVLVAATVPVLGIPSLVFRRYTQGLVATFTRFFEDIATYALDMSGEQLINAHVDRTVRSILDSDRFSEGDAEHERDVLVMAAHSLGTVVTHSYVVRHGLGSGRGLPARVLTFGSPVGMVSWLWLLLDFVGMDFSRRQQDDARYFIWNALAREDKSAALPRIKWINVVNHLDPIATAFPLDYVNLAELPAENAGLLEGGRVHQRFLRTGNSAAAAHTAYFDDRQGFLQILSRLAGLRAGEPEAVLDPAAGREPGAQAPRDEVQHWSEALTELRRLRVLFWLGGLAAIAIYLGAIAWASHGFWLMLLMLPFGFPPATIGALAFCQRFLCGRPTKRNSSAAIARLRWREWASVPHRLRQFLTGIQSEENERAAVLGPRPGALRKALMWAVSFLPPLAAMLLPFAVLAWMQGARLVLQLVAEHWKWIVPALLVFTVYLVAFATSEFMAHWRTTIALATRRRGG